jgi:hypothetical protein
MLMYVTTTYVSSCCLVFCATPSPSQPTISQYVRIDPRMGLIVETFFNARKQILSICVLLFVFLVGFSLSFTLGFGHRIAGFRSFPIAFLTLVLAIFGEFTHAEELAQADTWIGPLLLLLFQGFVNFCLVSFLISIVDEAYNTAQDRLEERAAQEGGETDLLLVKMSQQAGRFGGYLKRSSLSFWRRFTKETYDAGRRLSESVGKGAGSGNGAGKEAGGDDDKVRDSYSEAELGDAGRKSEQQEVEHAMAHAVLHTFRQATQASKTPGPQSGSGSGMNVRLDRQQRRMVEVLRDERQQELMQMSARIDGIEVSLAKILEAVTAQNSGGSAAAASKSDDVVVGV